MKSFLIFKMLILGIGMKENIYTTQMNSALNISDKYQIKYAEGDKFLLPISKDMGALKTEKEDSQKILIEYLKIYCEAYTNIVLMNQKLNLGVAFFKNQEHLYKECFFKYIQNSFFIRMFTTIDSQLNMLMDSSEIENHVNTHWINSSILNKIIVGIKREILWHKTVLASAQQKKQINGTNLYGEFKYIKDYNTSTSKDNRPIISSLPEPFTIIELCKSSNKLSEVSRINLTKKMVKNRIDENITKLTGFKEFLEENQPGLCKPMGIRELYSSLKEKIEEQIQISNCYDYDKMSEEKMVAYGDSFSEKTQDLDEKMTELLLSSSGKHSEGCEGGCCCPIPDGKKFLLKKVFAISIVGVSVIYIFAVSVDCSRQISSSSSNNESTPM